MDTMSRVKEIRKDGTLLWVLRDRTTHMWAMDGPEVVTTPGMGDFPHSTRTDGSVARFRHDDPLTFPHGFIQTLSPDGERGSRGRPRNTEHIF